MTGSISAPVPRRSMAIAALSTIVEWYDFTLYLYFATVLARVFFGGGDASLGITLAGFAISWLLRPLGAFCFGRIGDRYGRRRMLLISMAMMTGTMLLTMLLPTCGQMGPMAGVLFLLLRGVMAFSVGGEYTGVVAYLLESAPEHRRGLVTSLASAASEVGALLAAGVSALTVGLLSETELSAWGWRIPFAVGFVLAGTLWFARTGLEESPEFIQQRKAKPLSLTVSLKLFRRGIGRAFAVSALGSMTYYLGITYVPSFLVYTGTFSERDALSLSVVAAVSVIIITPFVGMLSDQIGRRPVLLFLAVGSFVIPLPVFWLMTSGHYLISMAGGILLACLAGGVSAVGTSSTAEMFPVAGRLTGLALGTTAATALFGGLTPWLAQSIISHSGSHLAPGLMITLVALGVLPVFMCMPETAPGQQISQSGTPVPDK
ncbi:TPA: MFS transporter [Enterobacter hormaechei subsp. xiangfangensis]|nr:MFS transporter [Enterobacter hormaechei subsp. xiangfangensis]